MFTPDTNARSLQVQAHAKINTYLEVLRKRPDGFHELVTEMSAIALGDTLTMTASPDEALYLDVTPPMDGVADEQNLVLRAARLLQGEARTSLGAHLSLRKRIPIAAGLGGGSADAAAALVGLNYVWSLGVSRQTLAELARTLGADVPFFVQGFGRALCTGRGDIITPIAAIRPGRSLLIVALDTEVPTPHVFKELKPEDMRVRKPGNALVAPAERLFPEIGRARRELEALTGRPFSMSGSGPSLFYIADQPHDLPQMAKCVRHAGYRCWRTHEAATPLRWSWLGATSGQARSAVKPR